MRRRAAWTFLAALIAGPVFADEPGPSPLPPPAAKPSPPAPPAEPPAAAPDGPSLDEVMKATPACLAFTNECEICTRSTAGPQCSTPGIACQPKAWRCSDR